MAVFYGKFTARVLYDIIKKAYQNRKLTEVDLWMKRYYGAFTKREA